jgi:hypothetical protein
MTTYTLLDIPGAELTNDQCEGFGCVDGCQNCAPGVELRARCSNCAGPHPTWRCPEIGAVLHAPEDDASDIRAALDRLSRLVDKDAEIASMRRQIARLQGVWAQLSGAHARESAAREALATAERHIGALVGALDKVIEYVPECACDQCIPVDAALSAARAWLRLMEAR